VGGIRKPSDQPNFFRIKIKKRINKHFQMNIVSVINTNTVKDIPNALRALANIVEQDIATQGCRANSIGMFGKIDNVSGDFDYQIQQTNITSISELLETR